MISAAYPMRFISSQRPLKRNKNISDAIISICYCNSVMVSMVNPPCILQGADSFYSLEVCSRNGYNVFSLFYLCCKITA